MKKAFFFILSLFVCIFVFCSKSVNFEEDKVWDAYSMKEYCDSISQTEGKTLSDARKNPIGECGIDWAVKIKDSIEGDTGRTIIEFRGREIFNETWNWWDWTGSSSVYKIPVNHGLSRNKDRYILLANYQYYTPGAKSKLFLIICKNGNFGEDREMSGFFWKYILDVQEMDDGRFIVVNRNTKYEPLYYSLCDFQTGRIDHYMYLK